MELNEKIQKLRKQKNLTQEELASILHVSRTAVSKWESGRGYPGIDSLKALAAFFSVSVDELLSSSECLTLAQEDSRQKECRLCSVVCGLLDLSTMVLLFIPFFAQRSDGVIQAVSLPAMQQTSSYLLAAYWILTIGMTALGALVLALQNVCPAFWKYGKVLSLTLNVLGVLLFAISLQPYPAVYLFTFLLIKGFLLIRRQ